MNASGVQHEVYQYLGIRRTAALAAADSLVGPRLSLLRPHLRCCRCPRHKTTRYLAYVAITLARHL
jgi:hypothetical protein